MLRPTVALLAALTVALAGCGGTPGDGESGDSPFPTSTDSTTGASGGNSSSGGSSSTGGSSMSNLVNGPPVNSFTCADFRYQEQAQAAYSSQLDADHDGIACESLPKRP